MTLSRHVMRDRQTRQFDSVPRREKVKVEVEGRRTLKRGTSTRGKGDGKKSKWKEGCALDQGQRESPLKSLRSKSLIYICAFLLPI